MLDVFNDLFSILQEPRHYFRFRAYLGPFRKTSELPAYVKLCQQICLH